MKKDLVLIHTYVETGFKSIVAFSDDINELDSISKNHPLYGSSRHYFSIHNNLPSFGLQSIKDECLINICKNVAEYLSVGEYAMLKKSYFKSAAWFEKAKNIASLGAEIIENY